MPASRSNGAEPQIVAVDDPDTYVCRPHAPGEIAAALTGHRLTKALRRGKFLWAETDDGPELGLHLGMAGHVVDEEPHPRWDRFTLHFADGGSLASGTEKTWPRGGRPRLRPYRPGCRRHHARKFRKRVGKGSAPLKARLLDQKRSRASATCSPTRRSGRPA